MTRTLNIPLLNTIIDWLAAGAPHTPAGFGFDLDKGIFRTFDEDASEGCGTTCCIAGAAIAFSDPNYMQLVPECGDEADWGKVQRRAAKLLGINGKAAMSLFFMGECGPQEAAVILTKFRDTGKYPKDVSQPGSQRWSSEFY
jgi:hypothetical protein